MENEFLMSACWQAMEMNPVSNQSQDCFYNSHWENSSPADQGVQFESAISSMVSSPGASNSNASPDAVMIRELIGKLGRIGNSSANTSCYSTPLNSPPKLNLPVMDHFVKESFPKLGRSTALTSTVAELSADPGFAERAARFSCFGSRSFNGRTGPFTLNNNNNNSNNINNNNNPELPYGLSSSMKMTRVSSSPSLKALGSQIPVNRGKNSEMANSQEESSVSEQNQCGEIVPKGSNELNSRKRKAAPKGKAKESTASAAAKVVEDRDDPNAKRSKQSEANANEIDSVEAEEDEKKNKGDAKKPPEPPKDYIHVRARRGQATDSHSLAERVRREKISERMKLLQDLVPGCNKVIGKALMLDEIINYVQSLQRQVEFLSMKLASVNTSMDFTMDALISKDMFQPNNNPIPNPMFPLDSSATVFQGHIPDGTLNHSSVVDPLNMAASRSLDTHSLPPLNDLQYQNFCGGDLQTIVQMGFVQNSQQDSPFQIPSFTGSNQASSHMKIEL